MLITWDSARYKLSLNDLKNKTNQVKQTATCLLALATIAIGHEIRRIHHGCTTAGCIYKPVKITKKGLSSATAGINCPITSDPQICNKIPTVMTKSNLPSLIVAPSGLVSVWQKELEKTILPGILQLRTAHRKQHTSFMDLYRPYTPNEQDDDYHKGNVVVLTSKESLDKRIMHQNTYYSYSQSPRQKFRDKVGRLQFARVLIDEAHDIRGVNTTFFNNLLRLAADGASIWGITATPLPKGAKSLAGCMSCWDATASARQLRDPLGPKLGEIDKAYNAAFRHNAVAHTKKEGARVISTRQEMDDEVEKLAKIMLDFTIQRRHETSFLGQSILYLPPTTKIEEWLNFENHHWQSKYQAFYTKDIESMRQFTMLSGQNYTNFLASGIDRMRMNRIYAGIPGLMEIPGQWTGPDLILARNKNERDGSSIADTSLFIGHRAFDRSNIDFLFKSSAKLQRLIKLLDDMKTGEDLPPLENNGIKSPGEPPRPPNKRKIVIFAAYPVECEIIEWVNKKSI